MFHLQAHINRLHRQTQPRFTFRANSPAELDDWRRDFRDALVSLLAIEDAWDTPTLSVERISSAEKSGYTETKYALHSGDDMIPLYVLTPTTPPPYKPIIAFHGHGPGVSLILGDYPDEAARRENVARDENFAQRLVQDGYLVCAIEQRGFGERLTNQVDAERQNACRHLAFEYLMHGKTLPGERLRDALRTIDYLQSRDDIVPDTIGCTGHSGGGTTALFLAALDDRISTSVVSGYFCDYEKSILGMRHCECNYVPGLLTLGNIGDITALIAPRPLCLIQGENDAIFPLDGVHAPYKIVQQAYEVTGSSDACRLSVHPGGHAYHYATARDWFMRWM